MCMLLDTNDLLFVKRVFSKCRQINGMEREVGVLRWLSSTSGDIGSGTISITFPRPWHRRQCAVPDAFYGSLIEFSGEPAGLLLKILERVRVEAWLQAARFRGGWDEISGVVLKPPVETG